MPDSRARLFAMAIARASDTAIFRDIFIPSNPLTLAGLKELGEALRC